MAPQPSAMDLARDLKEDLVKDRGKALDDLASLLNVRNRMVSLSELGDKSYHEIFEGLFSFAIKDKAAFYASKKSQGKAFERLSNCASVLRLTASRSVTKIGRKTLVAVIDHITQVLPGPDDGFVEPLFQDYVKTLVELLSRQAHVELLSRQKGTHWETCVDFFIDAANSLLPLRDPESGSFPSSRASPAPGQKRPAGHGEGGSLKDILEGIYHLIHAANAPILRRYRSVTSLVLRVLEMKHLGLGPLQTLGFGIVNVVFSAIQSDDPSHSLKLARKFLPLMSYWWRAEKISQDEVIRALRNEISRSILLMRLHFEHLAIDSPTITLGSDIEDLVEPLWTEYSKRSEQFRLQLSDLTFTTSTLTPSLPQVSLFGLRPHNIDGESCWAVIQNLAFLEGILLKTCKKATGDDVETEQPRKRRRTHKDVSRIWLKFKAVDAAVRMTALQTVPFLIEGGVLGDVEVIDLLPDLVAFAGDKNPITASWAMVACASCASCPGVLSETVVMWRQLWHLAIRALNLSGTSRAACVLLHAILEIEALPHHVISEDINSIITTADVNGPGILSDAAISLMHHILILRNARLPSASQATCNHIIRWIFLRWNPGDSTYASFHSMHVNPLDFVNLLRACCGSMPISIGTPASSGGALSESWKFAQETEVFERHLLLLEDKRQTITRTNSCGFTKASPFFAADPHSVYASKKLALELLHPKVGDMEELCSSWTRKLGEGGTQISFDRYQSLLSGCIIGTMLLPQIEGLNSTQSTSAGPLLLALTKKSSSIALGSVEPAVFVQLILRTVRPLIPNMDTSSLTQAQRGHTDLLHLLVMVYTAIEERNNSGDNPDSMDIDDDFNSQASTTSSVMSPKPIPRHNIQMSVDADAFYTDTKTRLHLLKIIHEDTSQIGLMPEAFLDRLLNMNDDELLSCQSLLITLFGSDLLVTSEGALQIVERLGKIVSQVEYRCCEVAISTCVGVIDGLHAVWLNDEHQLSEAVGDLYCHFVKVCMPSNILSACAKASVARLLFTLLRADLEYGTNLGLDSCRTSLLSILKDGPMRVRVPISDQIPEIFDIYVLKFHDDVFVDVLDSLPSLEHDTAGLALRMFALSNVACRWPTLLRRCTYHMFETAGRRLQSTSYATRCLAHVSKTLCLESPRELFRLFSPQLLFTWLELDSIKDIPFSIFGFASLADLLWSAQAEAIGLTIMRGQQEKAADLAELLDTSEENLIQTNFTTAIALSMMFGDAASSEEGGQGEVYIKKKLGEKLFNDATYIHFVDIVALFFDLVDQENAVEKYCLKRGGLEYVATTMKAIKAIAHSPASLPSNQQPMFHPKQLIKNLLRLCKSTGFQIEQSWTPALVLSVARKLFNSIHPAMGSLHACAVLRKVRILICFAGHSALHAYTLEMLLNSTRKYLVDSECADDALGISQYLLAKGIGHLSQSPSFLAGYALSTLASIRVFLESSQSSTTQESQFKATMSKAQQFHGWFSKYLEDYTSPRFKEAEQSRAFSSITGSAARIRASGNAEKGSSESKLLLGILEDEASGDQLLNEASRGLALGLLCGDFSIPESTNLDAIGTDEDAIRYAATVWKSCKTQDLSKGYLAWAGRVIGRSFSATGDIPESILCESQLGQYLKMAPGPNASEMGLLCLLQDLTAHTDSYTAGLAEAALRTSVSQANLEQDGGLVTTCQRTLTESLFLASQWDSYQFSPSDKGPTYPTIREQDIWAQDITSKAWLPQLSAYLSRSVPGSTILLVLSPILAQVDGFAEKAFPFVVHLVLFFQLKQQQSVKHELSNAMKNWFKSSEPGAKENLKLLINSLLYLRTQQYPKESSIADRSNWLEVDYKLVSSCASHCGMHKTGLLFAELAASEGSRSSRRSSTTRETDLRETLLATFENIDDPDAYYGLPEDASLSNVLARVEYENEGPKSLAFRGAQYDSHIRLRNPSSDSDAQALVKALGTLGLSGLSHSLLQTQENLETTQTSLDSTFSTARKLGIWNLPAPNNDHHAVTIYKAYQSIHRASELPIARSAIHDGFSRIMRNLMTQDYNAAALRSQLGALACLTELDDVLGLSDHAEIDSLLKKFEHRSGWMRSGLYDNVSQILSCRGTAMSTISQHGSLRASINLSAAAAREMEVRSMLTTSKIYRFHQATQESLNISTALNDLIVPCENIALHIDAAVKIEVANSLWDHGEMSTSIRMLQGINRDSSLRNQSIPVSLSDLLSKIGHRVSVARLEKPQDIQKNYLEPALRELKGKGDGSEAGQVFHQFAMFCDEQLQDPDGLEDLTRLRNLKSGKSEEVAELKALISDTRDSQLKTKYSHVLAKEKQWLNLDDQELRRVEQTRSEFVRLSLENYLLSLIASDEHNNDALRFTALWLERSDEDTTNKAVNRHLSSVPTRKFAGLMNQLTSRLQDQATSFQKMLFDLVYKICVDHPYHGMYQIWSGTKVRAQQKDDVANRRVKATERVAQRLATTESVAAIWHSIDRTSRYYHALASEGKAGNTKYKSGARHALKDSTAGHNLSNCLVKYRIPSPTMEIELSAVKDYSKVPIIAKLEPTMTIASGVSAPKIITAVGSNGIRYKQLVKGGHDDLRQDAIMEQVFSAVSSLLKLHRATQQRNLGIRTYKVLPLTTQSGLIEFVPNTIPLHEFLMPAHERYYPKDLKGSQCRKEIFGVQNRTVETRISTYRKVTEKFHPVMRYFFMENFVDPDEWFMKRSAYTRTTAAISMLGHILGLGDRHGHNILLDTKTGEVVHIDLGVAFEAGRILPVPELVPFRLTRDIVDGMGITKTEGVFRRCCEFTLDALREEQYSIMTILDVLRYDPLYTWSISPLRLAKLQNARTNDEATSADDGEQSEAEMKKRKRRLAGHVNEPSEADRALEIVRKKLSKTLSVTATVNDLINQATDERNLAVLYSGWAAYA